VSSSLGTIYELSGSFMSGKTSLKGSDVELSAASIGEIKTTKNSLIAQVVQAYRNGTPFTAANVYKLQEAEAPMGYTVEQKAINFVVDEQGNVTVLGKDMNAIVAEAQGTSLSFSDPETSASFRKVKIHPAMHWLVQNW
jgi:hypothetical protein